MKLVLCGDICPTEATFQAFEKSDTETLFGELTETLRSADFTVGNLECALTDSEKAIEKCGPNLKGRPSFAGVLRSAGFTHLGLSNNHVLDFGVAGLRDTARAVQKAGMTDFGWGEDDTDSRRMLCLEKDGLRVAILAVCEHEYSYALPDQAGSNPFDPFLSIEDVRTAKAAADYVIVMYHGGKEQCTVPSPRLRKACRAMIRAGADLILCQHSHCIGCEEEFEGGRILYGQGNFCFVAHPEHPHWRTGLAVELELTANGDPDISYIPVTVREHGVTRARGREATSIMKGFRSRTERLKDPEAWKTDWEEFCAASVYYLDSVRYAFTDVPEGQLTREVFPHYLDCEAHLDVYMTLFRTKHRRKESGA